MDLTEAARLMKQSSNASSTNPAQMQPPPLMMMQQAVAMQQFQFQQALLMQQVMASQQAAARAATVKSAAEMAAARAAEISKQLKGSDAEEEDKKPAGGSPGRSKSASRSRSVSRSKSRSPIRYRRDRSLSRSPIRYRRDRPYSPSRSRDYYSYRSRSRRGYYRGRSGDYPWNSFRRDWDRDRDRDYYPRSRRSRSRSRERVRRRSRTRSRSPRFRKERTPSPPRHKKDERKSGRSSRRSISRSRELKRTPSLSSRSPSASPGPKGNSRSPQRARETGSGAVHRREGASPVLRSRRPTVKELSVSRDDRFGSPDLVDQSDSLLKKVQRLDKGGLKESGTPKRNISVSPARSLSVSLNRSLKKDLESDEESDLKMNLKTNMESSPLEENDEDAGPSVETYSIPIPSFPDIKVKESSPEASSREENGDPKVKESYQNKHGRQSRRCERSIKEAAVLVDDHSDDNKELDDWRDDMKAHSREKERLKDAKRDLERKVEEEKKLVEIDGPLLHESRRVSSSQIGRDAYKASKKHLAEDSDFEAELQEDEPNLDRKVGIESGKNPTRQDVYKVAERSRSSLEKLGSKGRDPRADEHKWKDADVESDGVVEPDREGAAEYCRTYKDDYVFEGPKLAVHEYEGSPSIDRPVEKEEFVKIVERQSADIPLPRIRDSSEVEDDYVARMAYVRPLVEEEEDMNISKKGKEKQRSKDVGRKCEDEDEKEKRKERHRKHRKKHRREEEDEKEEEGEERDEAEGRRERKRHKKKHRKEDEDDRKDRKKRKHRSRGKSASDSGGDSPRVDGDAGKDDDETSPVRRKMSSRHKKKRRGHSKAPHNSGSSSE